MPTAAATTSERLRPSPGTSGMRGAAAADATDESGTTVTLEASLYGLVTGHPQGSRATLALGPDRRADPRAKILS